MKKSWMQYRAISFYWRIYLCVGLAAAITCSLITGSLLLGDSLEHSLRKESLSRIGAIAHGLSVRDHTLSSSLPKKLSQTLQVSVAGAIRKEGNATTAEGSKLVPAMALWGVDEEFAALSESPDFWKIGPGEVVLNTRLQNRLKVSAGDEIIVRISRQGEMPAESPMARSENLPRALRLKVAKQAPKNTLADFQLNRSALPPNNAFVDLKWLQEELETPNRINLMLLGGAKASSLKEKRLYSALRESWEIADMGLSIGPLEGSPNHQLRSARVFLEAPLVREISRLIGEKKGSFTWFSYGAKAGPEKSPYLFASAREASNLKAGEADILEWLAEDLKIKEGDSLILRYPAFNETKGVLEKEKQLRVRQVLPMEAPWLAPELMPKFPGLHDAQSCREWKPGVDIELTSIRDKDEAFWKKYRGAPKVFISMREAEALWSNPFGLRTSFLITASEKKKLMAELPGNIDPEELGLHFKNIKKHALESSKPANDLGMLFLGFGFVLISAALLLAGMIFAFGIHWRREEFLTLRALGYSWNQIRVQLFHEGSWCALIGSCIGVLGGMGCAMLLLNALATRWRTLVGSTSLEFHGSASSMILGFLASLTVSGLAIFLATRQLERKENAKERASAKTRKSSSSYILPLGLLALSILWLFVSGHSSAIHAFGSAILVFVALITLLQGILSKDQRHRSAPLRSIGDLALKYLSRNPSRSITTIAIVASGCFLVVAVAANRHDPLAEIGNRAGGTGGFTYYAETALPIYGHPNINQDWSPYGLTKQDLKNTEILSFREKPGDDASCLNQGSARNPGFLGAPWQKLAQIKAFSARSSLEPETQSPWHLLMPRENELEIPVLGDEATLYWGLGLQTGDTLDIHDERGIQRKLRVVATLSSGILQGRLILSEEAFAQLFPSQAGYKVFLINATGAPNQKLQKTLNASLNDHGFSIMPAWKRLALFQNIENTYLSIFQALGFLGLGLGCLGVAVLLLYNVITRREDLSILRSMGYGQRSLLFLLTIEHLALLCTGIFIGALAGSFAAAHALSSPGNPVPLGAIAESLAWILLSGLLSTMAAGHATLRKEDQRIIRQP